MHGFIILFWYSYMPMIQEPECHTIVSCNMRTYDMPDVMSSVLVWACGPWALGIAKLLVPMLQII